MSPKDEAEIRRIIMERRARFVAAALSATGVAACGAKSSDGPTPCLSIASPNPIAEPNPSVSPTPTVCLSIVPTIMPTRPAPTACLSPLWPDPLPTVGMPVDPIPAPTVCLSIAEPIPIEPPDPVEPGTEEMEIAVDAGDAGTVLSDAGHEGSGLEAGAPDADDSGTIGSGGSSGI